MHRLVRFASGLGIDLSPDVCARLEQLVRFVAAHAARISLTAITGPDDMLDRHLSDSIALAVLAGVAECDPAGDAAPSAPRRIVDIGSGAGFPGLPIAILAPACRVTLVEARAKKAAVLREAARVLDLANVSVECARAEALGRDPAHREAYERAVARALGPLPVVLECALPLVAVGGLLIAPRGARAASEVEQAAGVPERLGGRLAGLSSYRLLSGLAFTAVVVEKTGPTPDRFPRRPGVPARRPLSPAA
jgi:16S rRNA (guanine527-N7)-methyltransferase